MVVNLSALGGAGQQFFDDNGAPLSGGKLYSYQAGTTTPQTTYTNADGNVPHTNPIILNAAGRVATGEIWLSTGQNYKFVLTSSTDVLLVTWDNVTGINGTGITSNASNVAYDPAGAGATPTTVQGKLRQSVTFEDFGAKGDNATDDDIAITNALASNAGKIYVLDKTYLTTSATFSLQNKFLDGQVNSKIKAPAPRVLFTVNNTVKVSDITFDTYTQALVNNVTSAPPVNLTVQNAGFQNGTQSVINVSAPIEKTAVSYSQFKDNKGPSIRFGQDTYSLQTGFGPTSVTFNVVSDITTANTSSTVGGVLSYSPNSKIVGNDIRNVTGAVGDETFGVYTKTKYGVVAFNSVKNITSTGTAIYAINLKGSERSSTATPQGYGTLAIGNMVESVPGGYGLQMQADQQTAIGNFFDGVLGGIEQGSSILDDNILVANRTYAVGGATSRGVTASSNGSSRLIDALGVHKNVRVGLRYATSSTNTIDRLLIAGQHLECDVAVGGGQAVFVTTATPGAITNVHIKDITSKNFAYAVDLNGVHGGTIQNITATGLTTATRPINFANCKNITGRNVWAYNVQTTDATPTFAYQMAISNENLLTIRARCLARKSGGASEVYIERAFLFKQEANVASLVASGTATTLGAGAVGGLTASITSNRPLVRVTGIAAETWDWTVWIDFDLQ
jgi:hypothetical protein